MRWQAAPRGAAALLLAGLAALASAAPATPSSAPTLTVTYETAEQIVVSLGDGTPVGSPVAPGTVIAPGTYDVYVDDDANANGSPEFEITGPGVDLFDEVDAPQEYVESFQPDASYDYEDAAYPAATERYFSTAPAADELPPLPAATTPTVTGPAQANADLVGSSSGLARAVSLSVALSSAGRLVLSEGGRAVSVCDRVATRSTSARRSPAAASRCTSSAPPTGSPSARPRAG